MDFEEYTPATLAAAIRDPAFWQTEHIPITPHRALSHIHNPRADEDDVILLVGRESGDVVAHVGVLPDTLFTGGTPEKLGWFTAWWVSPQCKGRGIGTQMIGRAMELYDNRIAMSCMTEPATRLIDSLGNHRTLRLMQGLHLFFRPRGGSAGLAGRARRVLAPFLVRWMRRRLTGQLHLDRPQPNIEVEYARTIDAEATAFMQAHNTDELTRRGPEELNWILHWPWVLTTPIEDRLEHRYFFSCGADRFDLLAVKIYERGALIALLIVKVRDQAMSVPYSYFEAPHAEKVLHVVLRHVVKLGITSLFLYDPHLVQACRGAHVPSGYQEKSVRRSFIAKAFDEFDLSEAKLQDGDGDTVFF